MKSQWMLSLIIVTMMACSNGEKPAAEQAPAAATPEAAAAAPSSGGLDGSKEYVVCQTCHQANGEGIPGTYPPLSGSEVLVGDANIPIAIVLHGMTGPLTVKGKTYNGVMIPWGASLNDAQIAAILTYERSSWGNTASAVTAEQVGKVRSATAARTTPWTWDEVKNFKF